MTWQLAGGLDMLEIACGMVFGFDESIPSPPRGGDPMRELERSLLGPLQSSPCGVAFSGGRDSSAVLAAATNVARRHQLPDPVPVTYRFPGVATTEEASYQELVVRHLGISEWLVLEPGDELDIIGEASTSVTAAHGILFPGNIHFMVPMLDALGGGALLTGMGGDEVLDGHPNHQIAAMLTGRARPNKKVLRSLAKRYLRRQRSQDQVRRYASDYFRWLVPDARQEVVDRMAQASTADALFADRHLTSVVYRMRYLHRAEVDMVRIANGRGMMLGHPLLEPGFVGAVADVVGRTGRATRAELMRELFGEVLPRDLTDRTSKARFDDVFWTDRTAAGVAGLSLAPFGAYVDESAVRELWASDGPKGNTYLMIKYLWHLMSTDGAAQPGSTPQQSD